VTVPLAPSEVVPFPATARVVALAASAGGLHALERVLSTLPADLFAAVLIVQHLDATRPSHLAHILAQKSGLQVREAQNGEPLVCGVALVAPPGSHLVVDAEGSVLLSHLPRVHFVRPSADHLFRSIAEVFGERAIAVVLTGTGVDGASATLTVHDHGGIVLVQNEATSEFFGMPGAAIDTGHVDQVLPLDDIAGTIVSLVENRKVP
jgi:two-component system, chemotaxis family, protein-glutamate methylesterase/glutaminase